jgi:ComF family protein
MPHIGLALEQSWNFAIDLLFPIKCLGCQTDGVFVCRNCLLAISLRTEQICPTCGEASPLGMAHAGCRRSTALDGLIVASTYEDKIVQKLIHLFKYASVEALSHPLAALATAFILANKLEGFFRQALLVPVPLHPKRLRFRGFNQAYLIACEIGKNIGCEFADTILTRTKHTHPQVELTAEERKTNIKNAFSCEYPSLVTGRRIILFDDVATTAATLHECAKTLHNAGAKEVWALVLARG